VCGGNQLVVARMNFQIVYRHGGQVVPETLPIGAAIKGEIHAEVRAHIKQKLVARIFADNAHKRRPIGWKIVGYRPKGAAEIVRHVHVRCEIVFMVACERYVNSGRIEVGWLHPAHVRHRRHTREPSCKVLPIAAVVAGEPYVPVAGARIQQPRTNGGLGQSDYRRVQLRQPHNVVRNTT
jgi:hypothetical protein